MGPYLESVYYRIKRCSENHPRKEVHPVSGRPSPRVKMPVAGRGDPPGIPQDHGAYSLYQNRR